MAGNTYGKVFRVTTWGESHGTAIGAVIDGCPAGMAIDIAAIQREMARRRPGQGGASSPRKEPDQIEILSGIFIPAGEHGPKTTGTPIAFLIYNKDAHSKSYENLRDVFRPGHGDITYQRKYGIRDHRGGGRASARETAARVAAGAVAAQVLHRHGVAVQAYTLALGGIRATSCDLSVINDNPYCCPDPEAAEQMERRVQEVRRQGDTLGGIVEIRAACPPGLGEPVFDKLEAELAHGLLSIGAVKGVEFGAGFRRGRYARFREQRQHIIPVALAATMPGACWPESQAARKLLIRVAVKPIPSIAKEQQTINLDGTSNCHSSRWTP